MKPTTENKSASPSKMLLWYAVLLCASLSAVAGENIVFPTEVHSADNPTCYGSRLYKISLVQDNYVQYTELAVDIPEMRSFSSCFWMNVQDGNRGATPLNYALDEGDNTDNLTVQYRPSEGAWTLNLNGVRVYTATALKLVPNTWTHSCHSWEGTTGQWSVWQNGKLLDTGVNRRSIGTVIPSSGVMVTGQHQNTISNMGMDAGEGLIGSLTLLHVSSTALGNPHDFATLQLVAHLAKNCKAVDRGDVVGWIRTPTRGYGGALMQPAFESCTNF